jgi:hypothetical protein
VLQAATSCVLVDLAVPGTTNMLTWYVGDLVAANQQQANMR